MKDKKKANPSGFQKKALNILKPLKKPSKYSEDSPGMRINVLIAYV